MRLNSQKDLTFIDLFAGVGGFHSALVDTCDTKCLFASEIDLNAQKTYSLNFPNTELFGDITKPEIQAKIPQQFTLLCGGFPCQAFSIAGYQKGFADTRGTLFFEIEKIAKTHRPKVLFFRKC